MSHKKSRKIGNRNKLASNQNERIAFSSYSITFDPVDLKDDRLTPELKQSLNRIYDEIALDPNKAISELERLLVQYPDVPKIYNFLIATHSRLGHLKLAEKLAEEAYRKFPDYLFAKINYAQFRLSRGYFNEIPAIFDNKFDLKLLYPDRNVFHVTEFTGFSGILCGYYCCIGHNEAAKIVFDALVRVDPDAQIISYARSFMNPSLLKRLKFWLIKKIYYK